MAMAMDCEVVYAVVPRKTLTAILEEKAVEKANAMLKRVDHSMRLEAQEIESSKGLKQRRAVVQSLLKNPKALWK
jgi:ABC-type polar amino acid transport system ATPase subunit